MECMWCSPWCDSSGVLIKAIIIYKPIFWCSCLSAMNCQTYLSACFRSHDHEKDQMYERYVHEIKHGSFTLLVFLLWWADQPKLHYKRLTSLFATITLWYLYFIVNCVSHCLRGSCSTAGHPQRSILISYWEQVDTDSILWLNIYAVLILLS